LRLDRRLQFSPGMTCCAELLHADVPALAAIARRLCGNPFDADDLLQDTLERALRARECYAERGNRRGWLATIMRNRFRDRCRAARVLPVPSDQLDELEMSAPGEPAPWERITAEQLDAALAQLDPLFRRVYEMQAAGQTYAEIAHELRISINTVGTRLLRARIKLKAILNATATVC
jgi:RNA polymerase sigma-70 factor (ECF subfamily)